MKKLLTLITILLLLVVSGCGNDSAGTHTDENKSDTFIYEAENGSIEVPTDPQRVILLSGFTGNVLDLGVNVVGVDQWSKNSPQFEEELKDVEVVSDTSLEKIIELEPDLIIGLSNINNLTAWASQTAR